MAAPVPKPESIKFYLLLTMVGTKFQPLMNTQDVFGTNLWPTKELAQQQQLIEMIKTPLQKFEIYEIEWPTNA